MGLITGLDWISNREENAILMDMDNTARAIFINESPNLRTVNQYIELVVSSVEKGETLYGNYANGRVTVYIVTIFKSLITSFTSQCLLYPMIANKSRAESMKIVRDICLSMVTDSVIHELFHANQSIFTIEAESSRLGDDALSRGNELPPDCAVEDSVYDLTLRYLYHNKDKIDARYNFSLRLDYVRFLKVSRLNQLYGQNTPKYGASAFIPLANWTLCESALYRLLGYRGEQIYKGYRDQINACKEFVVIFSSDTLPELNAKLTIRKDYKWIEYDLYELTRITSMLSGPRTRVDLNGKFNISADLEVLLTLNDISVSRNVIDNRIVIINKR